MAGRRRRRGAGYPTGGVDVSTVGGGSGGIGNAGFDPLDVLSEAGGGGGGGGGGINIEISNIAQAAAESGPGGISQGATTGGGHGGHHQQHHQQHHNPRRR